jgi:hypothetical protein
MFLFCLCLIAYRLYCRFEVWNAVIGHLIGVNFTICALVLLIPAIFATFTLFFLCTGTKIPREVHGSIVADSARIQILVFGPEKINLD